MKSARYIFLSSIGILMLSLIVRFYLAGRHVQYGQDQARDAVIMMQQRAVHTVFFTYGPKASVGNFYLPPFYYQLDYWISAVTNDHPLTMHWFTTIVESFTPVVLFCVLRRFFSYRISLFVAISYVFSYLPIVFGTSAWNPNMIQFFSSTALLSFLLYVQDDKKWAIPISLICVSIAFHLHYQSVVIIPFAGVVFLWSIKKSVTDIKYWIVGGALAFLPFIPYAVGEYYHNWTNTKAIISFFTTQRTQYFDRVSKPAYVLEFIPSFMERVILGRTVPKYALGRLLFFVGFALLCLKSLTDKKYRWVLLYFVSIFIMLRLYKGDKLDYYLSTLFILPAFCIAMIASVLPKKSVWLVLVIVIASTVQLKGRKPNNDFRAVSAVNAYIRSASIHQPTRFLFFNDDLINIFAHAFYSGVNIAVDQSSTNLVEICDDSSHCQWNGTHACRFSRGYTYTSLLKSQAGYTQTDSRSFGTYAVLTGRLQTQPSDIGYSLYEYDQTYGTDVLLPVFTQKGAH